MGLGIIVLGGPIPHATRLTLVCDSEHVWPPTCKEFEHPDGYVGQYKAAMATGWKASVLNGARVFYGPCCSGKITAETVD